MIAVVTSKQHQGWWKVSTNFSQVFGSKNLTTSHSPKKISQVLKISHKNFFMNFNLKKFSAASPLPNLAHSEEKDKVYLPNINKKM